MATLVLTTLGTALGGPLGGALGSIVGQSIDRNLFGPGARRGPRLSDLSVQTSSYGSMLPRIYGRMRVAGTVVWATDLIEEEVASGGGKGAPGAVQYAYSASFAVALSSRMASGVSRIWADGKLLRASDGTFTSKLKFRFYPGSERQMVDPLIASIEGIGGSPAFRGIALAVFEDFALADFGNRIPSLTFELTADEISPTVGAVISDVSGGIIEAGDDDATLSGFAALGSDRRSAVEPLADLWGLHYHDYGVGLRASSRDGPALSVGDPQRAGCVVEGDRATPGLERQQEPAEALPAVLTIEYHDPARDYQAGQARATSAAGGRGIRRIDSACAMGAARAKSIASDALARRWAGRDRVTMRLAPAFLGLRPGHLLAIAGVPGRYRVEAVTCDGLVVVIEARRISSGRSLLAADPGRAVGDRAVPAGPSVPMLLDLPSTGLAEADAFGVTLAVGCDGRFRPMSVAVEVNGQPFAPLRVDRAAVTGEAMTKLGIGPTCAVDGINSFDVRLTNAFATLLNADDDALAMGANAIMVGSEMLQFGRALALGGGRYRLSRLVRGCRGTEWAMGDHAAGEQVVLLEADRLMKIPMDAAMVGAAVQAHTFAIADDEANPPTATVIASGESLRPMSPCHLTAAVAGGGLQLDWVARDKALIGWPAATADGGSTAVFRVTVARDGTALEFATSATHLSVAGPALAGLGEGPIRVEVIEQGAVASRPALLTVND